MPIPAAENNEGLLGSKILLITVNYDSADCTLRLLRSLRKLHRASTLDIVIVENASPQSALSGTEAELESWHNARVMNSLTNRGYFGGARWGLENYLAIHGHVPDWVIVCNSDIVIRDADFLDKLLAHDPSSVGVIAPKIESSATHLDQNPFMETRPDRRRIAGLRIWGSTYYTALLRQLLFPMVRRIRYGLKKLKRSVMVTALNSGSRPIYAPHGSFVIFGRRYFASGGYLDDGYFLYGEEISVAEICRTLGLSVIYDPALHVLHSEHQTTGRILRRSAYVWQKQALEYLCSKYLADVS